MDLTYTAIILASLLVGVLANPGVSRKDLLRWLLYEQIWDGKVRPGIDTGEPDNVTLQLLVKNLHSVSEANMQYSLEVFLRMWWQDERLNFTANHTSYNCVELDVNQMRAVWEPDLYFSNELQGATHKITSSNRLMHLFKNGTIVFSIRLSLTLSCLMHLQYYPFDTQACPVSVQSFGHTSRSILLNWLPDKAVVMDKKEIPNFNIWYNLGPDRTNERVNTEVFSTLSVDFVLKRKIGLYFMQVFVPSLLFVVLSWVSFWVDHKAVPARVSLGITCVLAIVTQSSGIHHVLPNVSYPTAIDIWIP
ncbi:glycine receptor subunit alpha-4-like isoform X2 [Mya arenaria]|uniref:glycine receptor subunit alpha-4-like isoform X2 n=1 Tax=Mya arenaria TaxID=6604 RepID=UPI0022E1295B|nr:glycine receptor subunit alpha-4-like isoform X2 [Mya arenaria]